MNKKIIIIAAAPTAQVSPRLHGRSYPPKRNAPASSTPISSQQVCPPFALAAPAIRAGRLMLAEISDCATRGESFAFETTLAGRNYPRHIQRWRSDGYHVGLFFLCLPTAETAIARVAARVRQGGHNIPEAVIRRRFAAGLRNLDDYKAEVDTWAVYENASSEPAPIDWSDSA